MSTSTLGEWGPATDPAGTEPAPPAGTEPAAGTGEKKEEPPPLQFASVEIFVARYLAPVYRRSLDGRNRTWCPEYWRHAEPLIRLEALWRAWEHLRQDPATGMSVWMRDHADHHMAVLFDPDGPFKGCSPDKGHSSRLEALPIIPPPPTLFAPEDHGPA